jgi:dinuclear metal center YbgI/SA1388 family protein
MQVKDVVSFLREFAPVDLAEDWDNVGLLVGAGADDVSSVLTCLTLTPDVAAEAIERSVQLVVTHHPVLFRSVQQITDATSEGRMLLDLIRAGVCVYSPHTSYDSASEGVNRQLSDALQLTDIRPLRPSVRVSDEADTNASSAGAGRFGDLPSPISLLEFVEHVKAALGIEHTWLVGDTAASVRRVGIACGAAAEFMHDAADAGCEVLLTGEARFHACLEARTLGIALVLPGHYATERPAMENLAETLRKQFPELTVQASEVESDPIQWV